MEIKTSDARICVIKMVERIGSVGSQKWKRREQELEKVRLKIMSG